MNNTEFSIKDIWLLIPIILVGVFIYWIWGRFTGVDSIVAFMKEWEILGYIILAFFSLGGSLIWTAAAGVAAYFGIMNIYIALTVGIVFNYLGDMFLFYLGKYQKKDIKPYFEKHKRKLALSTLIMRKYGVSAIFIQKFLYGVKTLVPISMALAKYDFKKFGFYNVFASILFVCVIMLGSYYSGDTIKAFFVIVESRPWIVPAFILSIIGIIWFVLENMTKKK